MENKNKFAVINMETGVIVKETKSKSIAIEESKLNITKEMLTNPSYELISHIYRQMKISGKIDRFGMIEMEGLYISEKFFEIGSDIGILAENMFKLKKALSVRGFVKRSDTTDCSSWAEVWSKLGIDPRNKVKVRNMKKIILDNDIIRETRKISGDKVYVVNPNILRHGSHTSDFCISTFKDITLHKIHRYNTYLMYLNGLVDFVDIT